MNRSNHAKVRLCSAKLTLTLQLYVRKHRDEPLARFRLERRDDIKATIDIEPRALDGQHGLFVAGNQVTPLLVYALVTARHRIIVARNKYVFRARVCWLIEHRQRGAAAAAASGGGGGGS